jgi:hypothetical protein
MPRPNVTTECTSTIPITLVRTDNLKRGRKSDSCVRCEMSQQLGRRHKASGPPTKYHTQAPTPPSEQGLICTSSGVDSGSAWTGTRGMHVMTSNRSGSSIHRYCATRAEPRDDAVGCSFRPGVLLLDLDVDNFSSGCDSLEMEAP